MLLYLLFGFTVTAAAHQCPPCRTWIEDQLRTVHIPGLAAIVVNSSDILYEQGFGFHSPISNQYPIDPLKSIFVLASLSKTFIALAAMQLAEKGQLNLDVDINQYLNFPIRIFHPSHPQSIITMRHILSHSSGLGSNYEEEFHHGMPGDDFVKTNLTDVVLRYLLNKLSWLSEAPGNVTYYTNVGAAWGALAIERISGLTFENYVRQRILDPLGISTSDASYRLSSFTMRKTDLVDQYVYNVSLLSIYHQIIPQLNVVQAPNSTEWLYIPHYSISVYPAAMLRMSARSLSIYLRLFLNNFSPDLLQNVSSMNEMLHVSRQEGSRDEPDVQYGLIWNWRYQNNRRLVGHRGWMPGVAHTMMANEKRSLGVILLSNGDITWGDSLAKQVSSTLTDIMGQLFDCFEQ
ncbi:unnamed protein product [Rotaria socialis]|uniref:Beta-lactamase-related domain-containing protein n=2 Tax=Rotaria socialis TaxID=392032 RepID=A0A821LJ70_9BILA|nr:unnamed protein product [Rotaria socialis]CAF3422991.1 unnamed protein product [Rotaria socialis]CAF4143104.1 unnamed protein product [Rotaria socialis]CAF4751888.1 unnamed protein product [Rotaria socialis]